MRSFFHFLLSCQDAVHEFLIRIVYRNASLAAYFLELAIVVLLIMGHYLYVHKAKHAALGTAMSSIAAQSGAFTAAKPLSTRILQSLALLVFCLFLVALMAGA